MSLRALARWAFEVRGLGRQHAAIGFLALVVLLDQICSLTLLPSVFWLASPRSNVLSIPLHFILQPHIGIKILVSHI